MKKILALLLASVLILGLFAGCGDETTTDPANDSGVAPTGEQKSTAAHTFGMLVLHVNATVEISYDQDGMVLEVFGADDSGNILVGEYTDYLGKTCSEVVCDLIAASNHSQMLNPEISYAMLKLAMGSQVPNENFLKTIEADAKAALADIGSTAVLVVLTLENLDKDGYIDLESAKVLMLASLAISDFDVLEGSSEPVDGKYGFFVTAENIEEYLIVDAVTGLVYQGLLDGVNYGDEWIEEEEIPETDPIEEDHATNTTGTEATEDTGDTTEPQATVE